MWSLRSRVILGSVIWAVVIMLVGIFALFALMDNFALKHFDRTLMNRHLQLVSALGNSNGSSDQLIRLISDPAYRHPNSRVYWQASNAKGVLLGSASMFDVKFPVPDDAVFEPEFWTATHFGGPVRGIHQSIILKDKSEWFVQVAESLNTFETDRFQLRKSMVAAFAVMGFLGVIGAVLQTSVSMRPIARLTAEISQRKKEGQRLEVNRYPQEVAPLVADLNELLERNHQIVEMGRRKAADLAHALKTPSSIIRNDLIEFEKAGVDISGTKDALGRIDEQINRSLARIRADNSDALSLEPISLGKSVDRIVRYLTTIPDYEHKQLFSMITSDVQVVVGKQDLEEIIGNLTENALKWCNSRVEISATQSGKNVLVIVQDDGPGIPKEDYERVLTAGERLDMAVPGSGLGLSITSDLLQSYAQSLELSRSSDLGGLKASFTLPIAGR